MTDKIRVRGVELSNPPDKLDWNYARTPLYLYVVSEPRWNGRVEYPPLPFSVVARMLVPEIIRRRAAMVAIHMKRFE